MTYPDPSQYNRYNISREWDFTTGRRAGDWCIWDLRPNDGSAYAIVARFCPSDQREAFDEFHRLRFSRAELR